jgi:hypothetical protein
MPKRNTLCGDKIKKLDKNWKNSYRKRKKLGESHEGNYRNL